MDTHTLNNSELYNPTYIVYETLNNYYCLYKGRYSADIAYNLFHSDLFNLISRHGWTIIQYIQEKGAVTKPELVIQLGINQQSVSPIVNKDVSMGILKPYGKVEPPFSTGDHRPPIIYGTLDATPEQVIDAQHRYAQLKINPNAIATVFNKYKHGKWIGQEVAEDLRDMGLSGRQLTKAVGIVIAKLEAFNG